MIGFRIRLKWKCVGSTWGNSMKIGAIQIIPEWPSSTLGQAAMTMEMAMVMVVVTGQTAVTATEDTDNTMDTAKKKAMNKATNKEEGKKCARHAGCLKQHQGTLVTTLRWQLSLNGEHLGSV
jgi:hypothetical protein